MSSISMQNLKQRLTAQLVDHATLRLGGSIATSLVDLQMGEVFCTPGIRSKEYQLLGGKQGNIMLIEAKKTTKQ